MLVLSAIVAAGCGGRTGLTPLSKIGRLSDSAVRAVEHGVTIVVRTEDWKRQAPDRPLAIPLQVTIDNSSTRRLLVQHRRFALVDTEDQGVVRAACGTRRI